MVDAVAKPRAFPLPLIGIDHGGKRLGVAVADETGKWTHPLETIQLGKGIDALQRVGVIAKSRDAKGYVIGLPLLPSGEEGEQAAKVRVFAKKLAGAFAGRYVALVDERLSTFAAEREWAEAREIAEIEGRGRNALPSSGFDALAARHILECFLREGPLEVLQEGKR